MNADAGRLARRDATTELTPLRADGRETHARADGRDQTQIHAERFDPDHAGRMGERPLGPIARPDDAQARISAAVREIITALGEDPAREGLSGTPDRVARMYLDVLGGLYEDPRDPLRTHFVADHHEGPVIVRDIRFHAMCEHHLLPFHGMAHVAYLPDKGVLTGLSKIARAVENVSRRPQLQERLTDQIAQALRDALAPRAILVVVEAEHMCMCMRGVRAQGAKTITVKAQGLWASDVAARAEIMALLRP